MTTDDRQPMLFADLPIPPALPEVRPRPKLRRGARTRPRRRSKQLVLDFWAREFSSSQAEQLDDEEDTPFDFPRHHRSVAGHEPPPQTTAVVSVWAMAAAARAEPRRRSWPTGGAAASEPTYRVEREAGRVRVVRLRPEETEERIERERERRARQRPPKPTRKAKTRSAKLMDLIGDDDGS